MLTFATKSSPMGKTPTNFAKLEHKISAFMIVNITTENL